MHLNLKQKKPKWEKDNNLCLRDEQQRIFEIKNILILYINILIYAKEAGIEWVVDI